MQFLRIAAVLSLVATVGTEVRAEWFSINNAISQAVLTNPGIGEGEVKVIVPVCVVVGNPASPACEPAGSAILPMVRAESPASNTRVSAPPGAGMTMLPGEESETAMFSVAVDCEPSAS